MEADRRREASLQAERQRRAQEEEEARVREANEAATAKALSEEREASLRRKRETLPAEPVPPQPAMKLRLQFPQGTKTDRRFRPDETLQVVRDFIDIYVADSGGAVTLANYSLSATFPKRSLDNVAMTLQEAGLHSADTVYITDLDA